MKKLSPLSILLVALLILFNISALAYSPVRTAVPVEIKLGGTATIIPEVNCPIPESSTLTLDNGEVGRFYIDFTETGIYTYTVKLIPDEREITFDSAVYTVRVFVTDENGELNTTTVVYTGDEKYPGHIGTDGTPDCLIFTNEPVKPTPPEETTDGTDNPPPDKHNPKTSDDTNMEKYFLVAMLASAGLFILSVVYFADTQKMIKEKRKNTQNR